MSNRPTSKGSSKSTCSPDSGFGASPPDSPDGETTDLFGQPLVPVRRSARPVKSKPAPAAVGSNLFRMFDELAFSYARYAETNGLPISVTSGPRFGGSFETSARHALWENRLRARTVELGSTLYELQWKYWPMTLGESIPALRASARPISASVYIGWPTTRAADGEKNVRTAEGAAREIARKGSSQDLAGAATLAGWPTPRTPTGGAESAERKKELGRENSGGGDLQAAALLAGWSTPSSRDWKDSPGMSTTGQNPDGSERSRLDQLPRQAHLAGWITPSATDGERGGTITPNMSGTSLTQSAKALAGWPTPNASDEKWRYSTNEAATKRTESGKQISLECASHLAGWPTPMASSPGKPGQYNQAGNNDSHRATEAMLKPLDVPVRLTAYGEMLTGSAARMDGSGQLSPAHSLWLQLGPFGIAWLRCVERVTRSTSRKRSNSSAP